MGSNGITPRNYGRSPGLNRALSQATGYGGDFGNGQFNTFMQQHPEQQRAMTTAAQAYAANPARDFGAAGGLNKALAQQTGYQGDFGNGGYQQFMNQHPEQQQAAAQTAQQYANSGQRNWGANPIANHVQAQNTGYQGDFGNGGFQKFLANTGQTEKPLFENSAEFNGGNFTGQQLRDWYNANPSAVTPKSWTPGNDPFSGFTRTAAPTSQPPPTAGVSASPSMQVGLQPYNPATPAQIAQMTNGTYTPAASPPASPAVTAPSKSQSMPPPTAPLMPTAPSAPTTSAASTKPQTPAAPTTPTATASGSSTVNGPRMAAQIR